MERALMSMKNKMMNRFQIGISLFLPLIFISVVFAKGPQKEATAGPLVVKFSEEGPLNPTEQILYEVELSPAKDRLFHYSLYVPTDSYGVSFRLLDAAGNSVEGSLKRTDLGQKIGSKAMEVQPLKLEEARARVQYFESRMRLGRGVSPDQKTELESTIFQLESSYSCVKEAKPILDEIVKWAQMIRQEAEAGNPVDRKLESKVIQKSMEFLQNPYVKLGWIEQAKGQPIRRQLTEGEKLSFKLESGRHPRRVKFNGQQTIALPPSLSDLYERIPPGSYLLELTINLFLEKKSKASDPLMVEPYQVQLTIPVSAK
jgi:hypothetical protein